MEFVRHLPLQGLYNARDLGGYAVPGGRTRFGVFVRSEAPCALPPVTVAELTRYGIHTAIDLRSPAEASLRPSDLRMAMLCCSCPQGGDAESFSTERPVDWQQVYITRCEDNRPWVRRFLELAAAARGGMLFHCTTGKDRTGLCACFLLSLAGVARADIVADYAVSELYLQPVFDAMRGGRLQPQGEGTRYHETMFHTPPSAMEGLLDYLCRTYGSVREYLGTTGVTEETLETIRKKFVEP